MRDQFKAQNPGMTFGQLAKYTSAMYAEMTPHEKDTWNARAEADKARYLLELNSYHPPPGYDSQGNLISPPGQGNYATTSTGRRSKTEKDPNAPKKNVSAYLMYQNAMRATFKRENPDMTFGQLAKYTSHMYKNLTAEEKASWEQAASDDKARYEAELANYDPPPGYDARGNLIDDSMRNGKRTRRQAVDPAAPKRARGSFVFFTFEMRPKIIEETPDVEFVQMGTILGERWRNLAPEEKKKYEDMAAQDKIRFQVEHDKYKTAQLMQQQQQQQQQAQAYAEQSQAQYYTQEEIAQSHQYHTIHDPTQQVTYQTQVQDMNQYHHAQPHEVQHLEHGDQYHHQGQVVMHTDQQTGQIVGMEQHHQYQTHDPTGHVQQEVVMTHQEDHHQLQHHDPNAVQQEVDPNQHHVQHMEYAQPNHGEHVQVSSEEQHQTHMTHEVQAHETQQVVHDMANYGAYAEEQQQQVHEEQHHAQQVQSHEIQQDGQEQHVQVVQVEQHPQEGQTGEQVVYTDQQTYEQNYVYEQPTQSSQQHE